VAVVRAPAMLDCRRPTLKPPLAMDRLPCPEEEKTSAVNCRFTFNNK